MNSATPVSVTSLGHFGSGIAISLLRADLIHPLLSGNKWFKLKYNLVEMERLKLNTLVTFGGAYSNHIAAVAYAGNPMRLNGKQAFETIGIIRGEEVRPLNPTLKRAEEDGMKFLFVSRKTFDDLKDNVAAAKRFIGREDVYVLPEGGSNVLAVSGCAEMLNEACKSHDIICCAAGTGATVAGLIAGSQPGQEIIALSAVKDFIALEKRIGKLLEGYDRYFGTSHGLRRNWRIEGGYHFGGYAKMNEELYRFTRNFRETYNIQLDYIYTAKMMFGIKSMSENGILPANAEILAVHSGGLQGNESMEARWEKKLKPTQ